MYTPELNYAGSDEIRFTVNNPNNPNSEGLSEESTIFISVNGVNDAPSIAPITDQNINEDSSLSLSLDYNDPDSEVTIVATSSNSENITATLSDDSNLTITPGQDYIGEWQGVKFYVVLD